MRMNLIKSKDTETTTSDRYSFTVKAMAPGKVILFGEHFVVYGFPSLIASIEKFFKVTIQIPNSSNSTIKIESNLGFTSVRQGSEIHIKPQSLGPIFGDVVSKLYKIVDYLTNSKVILGNYSLGKSSNNNDLIIKLESELPLGGGLGSSSAFCVALSTSLYYLGHAYLDKNTICIQSINAEKVINVDTSGADCNICSCISNRCLVWRRCRSSYCYHYCIPVNGSLVICYSQFKLVYPLHQAIYKSLSL